MLLRKKKNLMFMCIVFALMLIFSVTALIMTNENKTEVVNAASISTTDDLTFTLFTNANGDSEYKVALKTTSRPTVETVIIPDSYNGIPVTQIADSGFLSCPKLEKVILPLSVQKIGMNAFMNCAKLQRITMPRVKSIGASAFGMCATLQRLYIPETVETVETAILRNNAQSIYIQAASIGSGWSSTWNSYFTGSIITDVTPEAMINYQEIKDTTNSNVIGYEIVDGAFGAYEDIEIYSTYSPDGVDYKPVLNICPQAFTFAGYKSITFKHRNPDDEYTINIRSGAFAYAFVEAINFEIDVTFDHPENLQGQPFVSYYDGIYEYKGDGYGNSTDVFYECSFTSVTLPNSLSLISDRMFYNCTALKEIKISGSEYSDINRLPDINRIGSYAFNACIGLKNIYIPESVLSTGENIFFDWGYGADNQTISINIYEDEAPAGLDYDSIAAYVNTAKTIINHKQPITVALDLQGGTSATTEVKVKPDSNMPYAEKPTRAGYTFKGFYSQPNGKGFQYYTEDMDSARVWSANDTPIVYAYWTAGTYAVTLDYGTGTTIVNAEIDKSMPAAAKPSRLGYDFNGYYYIEGNGTHTYYYNANMESVRTWNINENATLHADWILITYTITYTNLQGGTNPSTNPSTYTVESGLITFANPTGKTGYTGTWNSASIPAGSTGNKTIAAVWTAIEYDIVFYADWKGLPNPNTAKYTVELLPLTFVKLEKAGYAFEWNPAGISANTTGTVYVTGIWTAVKYNISYNVDLKGLTNPNPTQYTVEMLPLTFVKLEKAGYTFEWNPASISANTTGAINVTGNWAPIVYTITYTNLLGGTNPSSNPATYTIESGLIIFANPTGRVGYNGTWNPASIPAGNTGNKTITAVWTPIAYTITYTNLQGGTNPSSNPTTYTIESGTITFANPMGRTGYNGTWNPASIPAGSTGNKTITAVWTAITYTITYTNLMGGTNPSSNPTTYTIESSTITFSNPTGRTGYNGTWNPVSISAGSTGNKTITAVWTPIVYSITYTNLQGGTNPSSNPTTYTIESSKITFANPTGRAGYEGTWNTASIPAGSTGNQTITAVWTERDYRINYDVNGGNTLNPAYKYVTFNKTVGTLPTPTFGTGTHAFLGWNTQSDGNGITITSSSVYQFAYDIDIYAQWEHTITFNSNGGSACASIKGAIGTVLNLPHPRRDGYMFAGWNTSNQGVVGGWDFSTRSWKSDSYTILTCATIVAQWTQNKVQVTINLKSSDDVLSNSDIPSNFSRTFTVTWNQDISRTAPDISGYSFSHWSIICATLLEGAYLGYSFANHSESKTITIPSDDAKYCEEAYLTLTMHYTKSCVAEGTLITLADGSQKAVELLTGNEMLLVWNLRTGKFDIAPILFIDSDPAREYDIINLHFSDGTIVRVISEHAFWDFDLNSYVFLKSDAAQYIGHWFNKQVTDGNGGLVWTKVQLTGVVITREYTTSWSPITFGHLCYYVNGMLSMPGATEGLINIFEVNGETMQYDVDAFFADIEEYGLFTYEEFAEIFPVPEEIFEAFQGQFLKISLGKGLIDFETLGKLIESYAKFFVE